MDVLEKAAGYIEYQETPVNRTIFGRWMGMDGQPWCMSFIQYIFSHTDDALPYKTASCSGLLNWYKANRKWCVSTTPTRGAIVIFTFGHTGILESWDAKTVTCIEGNTLPDDGGTLQEQANGGGVYRRTRKRSLVKAFIDPHAANDKPEGAITSMKAVKGSTKNEEELVKCWQGAIGSVKDGEAGIQTVTDTACKLKAITKPMTFAIWSTPVIICRDIRIVTDHVVLPENSINGSFVGGMAPCSISISGGKTIYGWSCHAWNGGGYPETVLYRDIKGQLGAKRVKRVADLPECEWAIGGMGLLDFYDPPAEGFCKIGKDDFSDVLRKTNHAFMGIKNGYVYLCYAKNRNGSEVNALAKKLGLEYAIQLDGGACAAINGTESFARINRTYKQHFIVQGV